jgi:hypothetical protein
MSSHMLTKVKPEQNSHNSRFTDDVMVVTGIIFKRKPVRLTNVTASGDNDRRFDDFTMRAKHVA